MNSCSGSEEVAPVPMVDEVCGDDEYEGSDDIVPMVIPSGICCSEGGECNVVLEN